MGLPGLPVRENQAPAAEDLVKRFIPSPGSILEIGCAEGTHTVMLADAFPGAVVLAVDISSKALKRARIVC